MSLFWLFVAMVIYLLVLYKLIELTMSYYYKKDYYTFTLLGIIDVLFLLVIIYVAVDRFT